MKAREREYSFSDYSGEIVTTQLSPSSNEKTERNLGSYEFLYKNCAF
jgi:hypothetical protein